jgi:uncharacterized protein YjbJ (UPF0337 family)
MKKIQQASNASGKSTTLPALRTGFLSPGQQSIIGGKWEQHAGAAKVAWGKLTSDEILQSKGELQKLSGLIQERYGISRIHADRKVKHFLESQV